MNYVVTGSLQIKRNTYQIVLNLRDKNNKPKQKWISTRLPVKGNKRKAEQMLQQTLADYNNNQIQYCSNMKFFKLMQEWIESDALKNKVRPSTLAIYKKEVNAHIIPYFKQTDIKLCDLLPSHLEQFYKDMLKSLSNVTVHKLHSNIFSALKYAIREHYISYNPAQDVVMKWDKTKKANSGAIYTKDQIAQLLEAVKGDVVETPITLIAMLGLRRSEVLGLKWDCIDFENNLIAIRSTVIYNDYKAEFCEDQTKTEKSQRVLAMSDKLKSYLLSVKAKQDQNQLLYGVDYHDDGFVCCYDNGAVIKPERVTNRFKNILIRNNLPVIRVHDLRHSAASNLLADGVNIGNISKWLGHKSIQTTIDIYAHLTPQANTEIASLLSV